MLYNISRSKKGLTCQLMSTIYKENSHGKNMRKCDPETSFTQLFNLMVRNKATAFKKLFWKIRYFKREFSFIKDPQNI